MTRNQVLRHATRAAAVTFVSRITGYVRDKALFFVIGSGDFYDAYRTANRIPNAFRALLAEGALHAAFVPALSRMVGGDGDRREARELVRGMVALLLLVLAAVVALGVLLSPWLVHLYAEGFGADKTALTVLMNRIMFPYLMLISLAALLQGILNSHDRFLLPAATPVLYNLTLTLVALLAVPRVERPEVWLAVAVLAGGALQLVVQYPAVRSLGYRLAPLWTGLREAKVHRVLVLMLPGIPVLGINQINNLVSNRFASFAGEGVVGYTYGASRITELMFGGVVIQLTTVLLPVMSRQLRDELGQAARTLVDTACLISFVTLPTATLLFAAARPVIGLAFGGGRFDSADVSVTGATLAAYAFGLVGLGQAKVMASAFYAQQETRMAMWGSLVSLGVFVAGCALLVGPYGAPGLGLANTIAMTLFALFLTVLYAVRHGFPSVAPGPPLRAVGRQLLGCGALAVVVRALSPWMDGVWTTSVDGAARVAAVTAAGAAAYLLVVRLLGGRELEQMWSAFRGRAEP